MFDIDGALLSPEAVAADPCPHGMTRELCGLLCGDGDPVAVVDPGRPVGFALALDCQLAGDSAELLGDAQLLDVVEGAERLERWASALRTRMLAAFADRHPPGGSAPAPGADPGAAAPVGRWLPDEVALTLRVSLEEARCMLAGAVRFAQVLPATLAEWEAGRIDERKAEAIAHATSVLTDELAREVEARVLPGAATASRRLLQDRLRRAVARVDPQGAARRHERARADRRMSISRSDDGMASLWFSAAADQTEASWRSVDRLARSLGADDPRTLDQRRVDLAHQLLQGTVSITDLAAVRDAVCRVLAADAGAAGGGGGAAGPAGAGLVDRAGSVDGAAAFGAREAADTAASAGSSASLSASLSAEVLAEVVAQVLAARADPVPAIGRKPLVQVVVSLDTLLGGDRPGELVGHGPVPATTARALAAGGVWKRLVVDPLSGEVRDRGRSTYVPPEEMADLVRARDGVCRGPLCSRPIRDLDHLVPWAEGGTTDVANLHGLCVHHHKLKDAPGWQVLAGVDGALTWISPCGRRETTRPHDYRPHLGCPDAPPPSGNSAAATTDRGDDDAPPF
ncbi:DUF222 domain-containing protein [Pseudonocardia sp. NPDC049635]|uniref:HNH endonuclease signature motif containing protein n=1 Tax=Pseudonocardia sp. NPDC049635 TaxID=3155506 RepID=UPI0033E62FC3